MAVIGLSLPSMIFAKSESSAVPSAIFFTLDDIDSSAVKAIWKNGACFLSGSYAPAIMAADFNGVFSANARKNSIPAIMSFESFDFSTSGMKMFILSSDASHRMNEPVSSSFRTKYTDSSGRGISAFSGRAEVSCGAVAS